MTVKDNSHKDVLDRELRKAELKDVIGEMHPVLWEIVDEGSWIIREAMERYDDNSENLAIPLLCYSQLDMLDAMATMCQEAIAIPAQLQLRSIHESHFFCRYLDTSNDLFKKRALAFVYEYHRNYMEIGKRLERRKGETSEWIDEHLVKLSDAGFGEIIEEHARLKKERPRFRIPWYSLFGGPSNRQDVVKLVLEHIPVNDDGGSDSHGILYKIYSQISHGNDHFLRMFTDEDGSTQIRSIRSFASVTDFVVCYGAAARMVVFSLCLLLSRNCANHKKRSIDLWIKKVQPRLVALDRFTSE